MFDYKKMQQKMKVLYLMCMRVWYVFVHVLRVMGERKWWPVPGMARLTSSIIRVWWSDSSLMRM